MTIDDEPETTEQAKGQSVPETRFRLNPLVLTIFKRETSNGYVLRHCELERIYTTDDGDSFEYTSTLRPRDLRKAAALLAVAELVDCLQQQSVVGCEVLEHHVAVPLDRVAMDLFDGVVGDRCLRVSHRCAEPVLPEPDVRRPLCYVLDSLGIHRGCTIVISIDGRLEDLGGLVWTVAIEGDRVWLEGAVGPVVDDRWQVGVSR